MKTDLSGYTVGDYDPGPRLKRVFWYVVNYSVFYTAIPFPSAMKSGLLRLFGGVIGKGVVIKPKVRIKYPWKLTMGDYCWLGEDVWIDNVAPVSIGSNTVLSQGALLLTGNHNYKLSHFPLITGPILLEDGVWIAANAVVCPGVTCRSHAVLAVASVATRELQHTKYTQEILQLKKETESDMGLNISIITTTYNSAMTIGETMRSVADQDYPFIEHIIVDSHSADNTLAIVAGFSHTALVVSEKDDGLYYGMNKGIIAAKGDVIGILNSDDIYAHAQVISHIVDAFTDPKVEAVYGDLQFTDPEDMTRVTRTWKSGTYEKRSFYYGWMPPHPTFFVRKSVYDQLGLFDTRLRAAADYEMMLRILLKNERRAAYVPEVLVKMRAGGASNSSFLNRIKANREDRRAWRINELEPYFFTLYLKPLRKVTQFILR